MVNTYRMPATHNQSSYRILDKLITFDQRLGDYQFIFQWASVLKNDVFVYLCVDNSYSVRVKYNKTLSYTHSSWWEYCEKYSTLLCLMLYLPLCSHLYNYFIQTGGVVSSNTSWNLYAVYGYVYPQTFLFLGKLKLADGLGTASLSGCFLINWNLN